MSATNIIPMTPEKGVCEICENTPVGEHTPKWSSITLRWTDKTTGQKFGDCCRPAMTFADRILTTYGPQSGLKHPQPPTAPEAHA